MSKVAFLADIHLGLGNRKDDILWALNAVRKYCKRNSIETVIILGDLFHDRQSLGIDILCDAYDFFTQAKADDQQWIAFPGNHDMFLKHSWGVSSLKPLGEVLTIIDTVKIIKIDGRRFWVLPFIYSESSYMKVLDKIEEQHRPGDVLLTHIGTCSAKLNICFLLQKWSLVTFSTSKFKQIYAGHFHLNQQVDDNCWYVGSILPFKFDEGDSQHGFYLYDTETGTHEFIDIWDIGTKLNQKQPVPAQYHTFHDDLLEEKATEDVNGCNIRIAATRDYSTNERQEIRDRFQKMGAKVVTFTDMLRDDNEITIDEEPTEAVSIEELFEKWFDADARGTKGLQRSLALRLNREVINEGDELYSRRQSGL